MELEFEKKAVSCLDRKLRDVQSQEQTLELRLPEGMPDIGSVLGTWGQCILRGKEWRSSEIGVSGGVTVWVLYQSADGSGLQTLEAWLPMQQKWSLPDCQREGIIRTKWYLKSVDSRALSVRKLMLRASVQVFVEALEPAQAQQFLPMGLPEDVQLLRREYPALVPREAGEKTFRLEDELPLPAGAVEPEKIVHCQIVPQLSEQKVVGAKAVFRGTVRCHVLYLGEDGILHSVDPELSFAQFEDLESSYDEGATLSVLMDVTGFEPEVQDGRIKAKCGMTAQYAVHDRMMVGVVEDAYSPVRTVTATSQLLNIPNVLDAGRKILQPEVEWPDGRIVDAVIYPEYPAMHRAGELVELEFPVNMQVLAYNEGGQLEGSQLRWTGQWELPAASDAQVHSQVLYVAQPQISGGRIMGEMEAQVDTESDHLGNALTSMDVGEPLLPDPDRPSVILRRAPEGSLWELAKKTGSTVEAIRAANQLTQDPMDDRILLIPIP